VTRVERWKVKISLSPLLVVVAVFIGIVVAVSCDQEPQPQDFPKADLDVIHVSWYTLARIRTPGGWLVFGHHAAAYVPDAEHTWEWKKP